MSEQIAESRRTHSNRRKPSVLEPQSERTTVGPVHRPPAVPPEERSRGIAVNSPWLRRRHARGRDDVNGEPLAVLSHELRNSLCIIRMAAGILNMEISANPAVAKARTLIEHQTAHMSRLVEDLLDRSRARNGQLALNFQPVDLCVVVAQAAQSVEFTMQRRSHCMTVSLPAEPLWLQADAARLEQVFGNLLFNAAKYTNSGGEVHLSVERAEGEAVVRIRDNGIGIAPEILPRVFDLFVQADPTSHQAGAGLGIGLALVRNLVDRHGGCVSAASAGLGQGSEFVVHLPLPG